MPRYSSPKAAVGANTELEVFNEPSELAGSIKNRAFLIVKSFCIVSIESIFVFVGVFFIAFRASLNCALGKLSSWARAAVLFGLRVAALLSKP